MILWVLVALAFLTLLIHAAGFVRFTVDDAYITFTYSKNLANGQGLVFSQGNRVEATSSMLWAVLLAPFEGFLNQGAVIGSKILGVLCALSTLLVSGFLLKVLLQSRYVINPAYLLFAFLLAGGSPFIVWATYGMENGLVALLLILATLCFMRDVQRGSALSALPVFLLQTVRPEGFIYVAVFAAMRLILYALPDNRRDSKSCVRWFVILGVCIGVYEAAGFAYYGHWLPNTVRAKVGGVSIARLWSGLQYLKQGSASLYSGLLLLTLELVAFRLLWPFPQTLRQISRLITEEAGVLLVSSLLVVHWLFTIFVGGDWMINARFLSHAIPLLLVLFVVSLWQTVDILLPAPRSPQLKAAMTLFCLNVFVAYSIMNARFDFSSYAWQTKLQQAEERALTGMVDLVNNRYTGTNVVLACSDVGRVGYLFKGGVLDWWGLADEEIARLGQACGRLDPDVVLRRKPDFLVLYSNEPVLSEDSMKEGMAMYSRKFWRNGRFLSEYKQVASLYFWNKRWHVLFQRNSIQGTDG